MLTLARLDSGRAFHFRGPSAEVAPYPWRRVGLTPRYRQRSQIRKIKIDSNLRSDSKG